MREELIMLTAAELDVENVRPVDFPEPRRVYAWIRYPSKALRIQAHAIEYPKTAVKIRFFEPLTLIQREGRVWLNAVTPAPTMVRTKTPDDSRKGGNIPLIGRHDGRLAEVRAAANCFITGVCDS